MVAASIWQVGVGWGRQIEGAQGRAGEVGLRWGWGACSADSAELRRNTRRLDEDTADASREMLSFFLKLLFLYLHNGVAPNNVVLEKGEMLSICLTSLSLFTHCVKRQCCKTLVLQKG